MVISNLRMPLRPYISLGEAPKTFEALYDRISRMKFDYEEGILFTLMDPKKHGNKKIPSQSGTGTGNTNTTGPESNANLVCQNDATRNRNTRSGQALGQQVRNTPNQDYRKVPHTYESNGNNGNYWKNDNGERRRRGPKRHYYPPLLQPIDVVFWNLVETKESNIRNRLKLGKNMIFFNTFQKSQPTVFELINATSRHQRQLLDAIQRMEVPENITLEQLAQTIASVASLGKPPPITFTEEELEKIPPEVRTSHLCLTVVLAGYKVNRALVDIGASLNICPVHTFQSLNLALKDLIPAPMTIIGYDGNRTAAADKVNLLTRVGPIAIPQTFHVVDIPDNLNRILRRRWLDDKKAIASTRHQCVKFPFNDVIIKVDVDPPMLESEIKAMLPTFKAIPREENQEKIFRYGVNPLISISDVGPTEWIGPLNPSPKYSSLINATSILPKEDEDSHQAHGWTLMRKLGYEPGTGLGRNNDGMEHFVRPAEPQDRVIQPERDNLGPEIDLDFSDSEESDDENCDIDELLETLGKLFRCDKK
ncbi:hypothetical protein MRB53_034940 [Persea americana]|uniref:Uncharacterized protein n=1 Tax=Persea americana TaxID=3435 RepID=A0ACC2K3R8_PERAE|nr:hypothetical protein MRB53_034940 [Persea americana]